MNRKYFIQTLLAFAALWKPLITARRFFKQEDECKTGSDVQGPFYRKDAPIRSKLYDSDSFEGKIIIVKGKVFASDCETSLPNVVIDIWHADPSGEYDSYSDKFNFRGKVTTDEYGAYFFETLKPAPYVDGGLNRPAHVHFKVRAEGYKELTTQLYFEGDDRLKDDIFVRRNNGIERVRPISERNEKSEVHFDIYL